MNAFLFELESIFDTLTDIDHQKTFLDNIKKSLFKKIILHIDRIISIYGIDNIEICVRYKGIQFLNCKDFFIKDVKNVYSDVEFLNVEENQKYVFCINWIQDLKILKLNDNNVLSIDIKEKPFKI